MKLLRSHYFLTLITGLLLVVPKFVLAAGFVDTINESAQAIVYSIVMGIMGMFVWLAALLLSFAVNSFVIGFGDAFVNTGIGVAVDNTWIIVRDFVNLGFIFGFVYIGFKMILNSSDSNTRRWLVNIILAALLVNFSLFVVKFAIDVSNQLAAQIAINGLGSTCVDCTTEGGLRQIDIASEFMARMGISNSFGFTAGGSNGAGWGYIFGTAMLMLTAMFVFAAGGIMLIMRFAVLNLFMVLSPVMFLSWIIPSIKDTFERFWSMFIGRALVAPIYLLFIYFSLQIISGLQVSVGKDGNGFANPDWAGTFQGAGKLDTQGNAVLTLGTFPFFILICIFLGLSVWAADKLGADGGSKAVSMGKAFANRVRKTAVNNSVGVGMRGVNRASSWAQEGYGNIDARMSQSKLGRYARGALTVASLGALSDKNVRGTLDAGKKASIDGSETAEQVKKQEDERRGRQSQALGEMQRGADMNNFNTAINSTATTAEDLDLALNGLGRTIRQMSGDERSNMKYEDLSSARVAMHLSDSHIEALEKTGKFSYQQIQNIKNARNQAHLSVANGGTHPIADPNHADYNANRAAQMSAHNVLPNGRQLATPAEMDDFQNRQRASLIGRDVKAAGNMEVGVFTQAAMAEHLTPQALDERMRNGGIREDQLDTVRTNIVANINADLQSQDPNIVTRATRRANMWNAWSRGNSSNGARFGINIPLPQNQNPAAGNPPGNPGQPNQGGGGPAQQHQQNQQARQARAAAARNNRPRPRP